MARKRKPGRTMQLVVYLAVRTLLCVIQALPLRWCYRIADAIAWLAFRLDRRHTRVAIDNLRHAFPNEYSEEEFLQIVQRVYRHFAAIVVDIAFIVRKLHEHNWRQHIRLEGHERVVELLLGDRPVILQSGHFGNWEIAGYVFGLFGFVPWSVARTLDNRIWSDFSAVSAFAPGSASSTSEGPSIRSTPSCGVAVRLHF